MKNNTETINEGIFTHFPSNNTKSYTRTDCRRNQIRLLINTITPAHRKLAGISFHTRLWSALFSTPLRGISIWKQIICLPQNENLIGKVLKDRVLAYRNQLQSGVATMGIGTVVLITVYLFLAQLAEYGWK